MNRTCNTCTVEKPIEAFHSSVWKNGVRYYARKCAECKKPAARERKKRWYYADQERAKFDSRRWYAENKEYATNAVMEYRKARGDWFKVYHRTWRLENKGKLNAWWMKYHAAKLKAIPLWADLPAIAAIYESAKAAGLCVDHIVPLRSPLVCGLHVEANLQLLTAAENVAKSNRHWPDMP